MDPKESLENFDPTEQVTLDFLGRGILQKWAASFYQYEAGILDAEQDFIHRGAGHADDPYLESVDHVLSRTTSFPGFRQWWKTTGEGFNKAFHTHINELMAATDETPVSSAFHLKNTDAT